MSTKERPPAAARRELSRALDAGLFKALGDPTRLHLLTCLAGCCGECSVSQVAACTNVDVSVVSRHLAQLEAAGVLSSRKEGKSVLYTVAYARLAEALRRLSDAVCSCDPANRSASCRCGCLCCKGPDEARKGCC
ncbi:MAG TPA: metalloregulator ArsR/SmtB family transcription factor [Phycisphaerales bacterium]|nr:metalloregulator ArsR/SmtB family transcription factor [Phycisphaerales bacterium]